MKVAKVDNWEFNLTKVKDVKLPDPYGADVVGGESQESKKKKKEIIEMKMNKAKDLVMGQGKSIFMTFISSFFIGRNLSLFTIFIYGFYAYNAFSSIMNVNNVFKMLENPEYSLFLHKVGYVFLSSISFLIIMYKIYGMGLIPLSPADWANILNIQLPEANIYNLK